MDKLFIKNREQLYWSLMRVTEYNRQLTEDLVNDTYIKARRYWDAGKYKEVGKFDAWVWWISLNLLRDHWRMDKRIKEDFFAGKEWSYINQTLTDTLNPEEAMIDKEVKMEVIKAIDFLHPDIAETMERYYLHEVSYSDIARETGLSINTILGRGRYGRKNLKKLLSA